MRVCSALVALSIVCACASPRAARPDAPPPQQAPANPGVTPVRPTSLVDAAVRHLAAHAPADRPLVLLLSVAAGDASGALAAQLRAALATARVRVLFANPSVTPAGPLPSTVAGEHAQSVESTVTPWPDRVVRVSAADNAQSVAVRLPGSDPLGPATEGWEWFETRP